MTGPRSSDLLKCLSRLKKLQTDFRNIFEIFGKDTALTGERKLLAQERMRSLKEELRSIYRQGSARLGEVERCFYFPAVHEAFTSIHVAHNSRPNQKWIDELVDAKSSIDYYASQLERSIEKKGNARSG